MSATKEQRAMMAAHLCDIAARMLREGTDSYAWNLLGIAHDLRHSGGDPVALYRFALGCVGVELADRDAACASIARGEHPADSLPGRVAKMRSDAVGFVVALPDDAPAARSTFAGVVRAADTVLDLLGCKVTP